MLTPAHFTIGHTSMLPSRFRLEMEQEIKLMKNVFDWNNFMECVDEVKPETCKPYETVLRHGKDPNKIS